jgi:hypothetical protein
MALAAKSKPDDEKSEASPLPAKLPMRMPISGAAAAQIRLDAARPNMRTPRQV